MKKLFFCFFMVAAMFANAQSASDASKPGKINAFSTVGIGIMDKDYKPVTANSIQTSTGLEYRFSGHSGLGVSLGFDSYTYETTSPTYNLEGTLRSTAIALFYRYKFGTAGIRPYLKAGGGGSWVTIPTVSSGQGITTIKKETQFVSLFLGEAGIQFRIHPRYSLLLGAEKDWFSESSLLSNASLRTTTIKVGLISSL